MSQYHSTSHLPQGSCKRSKCRVGGYTNIQNPLAIALARKAFSLETERNVEHFMENLKEKDKSLNKAHQETKRLERENQALSPSSCYDKYYQCAILGVNKSLEHIVKKFYQELEKLQKVVAILVSIQNVVKGKYVQLKDTLLAINMIHTQSMEHLNSREEFPRKYELSWERVKAKTILTIQTQENLERYVMRL